MDRADHNAPAPEFPRPALSFLLPRGPARAPCQRKGVSSRPRYGRPAACLRSPAQVFKKVKPTRAAGRKTGNPSARAPRASAGATAPAKAPRCPLVSRGQSPRPAPAPPTAGASRPPGRALACRWCVRNRSLWQRSARAGETQCVSCSRPKGQSLYPDREEFPGRQAVGLLFQHPVRFAFSQPM